MVGKYDGSLIYDTKMNTDGFEQGSKKIKDEAKKTGNEAKKSLEDTKASLEGINKVAKTVLLTTASVGAGILAMGINYNSQIENYRTSFEVMTGSAEKAVEVVERLKKMGAATPFELPQLAETTQLLMNYGFTADEAIDRMTMLGDISQGNADKLGRVAMAYGQMSSANKVALEDVKQMIEAGFNPLQEISQTTGESMASLYDRISKGTISVDEITASMKRATSEGGKYFQSMEKQSKTFQGQWSTLKDNVSALTGQMASDISEKLTTTVLPDLIDKVDELSQMWEDGSLQDGIGNVITAIATFGAAIVALNVGLFIIDMQNLTKGVKDYTTATKAGAAAQKLMNAQLLKHPYVMAGVALATLVAGIATYVKTHKSAVSEFSKAHTEAMEQIDKNTAREIAQAEVASEKIHALIDELFVLEEQLKSNATTEEDSIKIREQFNQTASELEEYIPNITSALIDETGQINIQDGAVKKLADSYIELATAKATANAYEKKLEQAISDRIDAEETLEKTPETEKYFDPIWFLSFGELATRENLDYTTAKKNLDDINNKIETLQEESKTANKTYRNMLKELGIVTEETGGKIVDTTTQTTKTLKAEQEKQLRDLKHSLEMGEISHDEYYKKLAEYRNTYFEEGSSEWQQYTEEIYDYYIGELEKVQEEADRIMTELKEKQQSIKENLYSDANMGFSKVTIKYGDNQTEEYFKLADMSSQNKQLQTYSDLLDELFAKRGELPEDVLNQLATMSTEDGIKYVESMLKASDKEWDEYVSAFLQREGIAEKISNQLVSSELDEAKKVLEDKFGEVPEDFFGIGEDSASYFGEGFISNLEALMQQVRNRITTEMNAMIPATISYAGVGGVGGNINNTYTNNYTFNSSKDTTTQQLRAANDAATAARLRGGN